MIYYRAYLERKYVDNPKEWFSVDVWEFFNNEPDQWLKHLNNNCANSVYRIKYLHVISEDDYVNQKVYTKPLEQIIFH